MAIPFLEILRYDQSLKDKGLPDIPLHAGPLMTEHEAYPDMPIADRKRLLSSFRVFFRNIPIRYQCISLKLSDYSEVLKAEEAMRRAIVSFLSGRLIYFQQYDGVKIYYDNGQKSVAHALHNAIDSVLSKDAIIYRAATPEKYRLSQAADYVCTMELAALRYRDKCATATDEKFFGSWRQFKKGVLEEMWAKRL